MAQFTISEVARQVGLRPSAIRYYEQAKVLPPAIRIAGQRRYGIGTVYQLAVLRRAQEVGFTLDEIRQLLSGPQNSTSVSARWRKIAAVKQAELDAQIRRIQSMKDLLLRLETRCHCDTVSQCGAGILRSGFTDARPGATSSGSRRTLRSRRTPN
jgi:MerR family transcriptional regulator, redox-sensitive transcriptional activator SoxR